MRSGEQTHSRGGVQPCMQQHLTLILAYSNIALSLLLGPTDQPTVRQTHKIFIKTLEHLNLKLHTLHTYATYQKHEYQIIIKIALKTYLLINRPENATKTAKRKRHNSHGNGSGKHQNSSSQLPLHVKRSRLDDSDTMCNQAAEGDFVNLLDLYR